jgi:DNA-binding response OmpR family regulator
MEETATKNRRIPLPRSHSGNSVTSQVVTSSDAAQLSALRSVPEDADDRVQFRNIVLDRPAHSVTRRGREVHLSITEFRLFAFFMRNVGRVLSREELFRSVWNSPGSVPGRTVDVHVGRLRKALARNGERDPIRTIKGAGYALGDSTERVWTTPSHPTSDSSLTAATANHATVLSPVGVLCPSGIELDTVCKRASRFGRDLKLSPKEFKLLRLLVSNRGKLLTREQIADAIGASAGAGRAVDKTVERLRKAINWGAVPDPIRSVLGAGYKFSPDPQMRSRQSSANRKRNLRLNPPSSAAGAPLSAEED